MDDTPKHVLQKQFGIMYSKPLKDKIRNLFEMTELSRSIILNQLRLRNPHLSEVELKIEVFKTFYRSDFDEETLHKITSEMKEFLEKNQPYNDQV